MFSRRFYEKRNGDYYRPHRYHQRMYIHENDSYSMTPILTIGIIFTGLYLLSRR